ncbi:septum site-determining protein MinC [Prosthecomicrobium hirschii]|nr:septum site-determining protein MinC [Prosthecomicrobium hirschii]MCW1838466.1 septum site-determining protein MinC [Prosthecomicrobium hirschii]
MNTHVKEAQAIRFRGRSFMAFVLEPVFPVEPWCQQLSEWLTRSPGFFAGKPVILDVSACCEHMRDVVLIVGKLEKLGIRVMGIDGAKPEWLGPGLPPAVTGGRSASAVEVPAAVNGEAPPQTPAAVETRQQSGNLFIETPVRSGQTIYAEGDVTIIGSVASGAEIVAGGSIHVYGALRGRAVAGATGNSKARIFARRFEAELVAIDGLYRTAEDMPAGLRGKAVQAWLQDDKIETAVLA